MFIFVSRRDCSHDQKACARDFHASLAELSSYGLMGTDVYTERLSSVTYGCLRETIICVSGVPTGNGELVMNRGK